MCYIVKLDGVGDDKYATDFERNLVVSVTVKLCMPESC